MAPAILLNVAPPSLLTFHWTVAAGLPLAAAVNVTLAPALTVCEVGLVVTTTFTEFTVKVAGLLVTVPALFVKTASNCCPLSAAAAVKL